MDKSKIENAGEVELTYKSTSTSRNKIYSSEDAYKYLLSYI